MQEFLGQLLHPSYGTLKQSIVLSVLIKGPVAVFVKTSLSSTNSSTVITPVHKNKGVNTSRPNKGFGGAHWGGEEQKCVLSLPRRSLFADSTKNMRKVGARGQRALNDTAFLLRPVITDPQNADPAPSVNGFYVVTAWVGGESGMLDTEGLPPALGQQAHSIGV